MDNAKTNAMVRKRYSIRDNAIDKSIGKVSIDVSTGAIIQDNEFIDISDVKKEQVITDYIENARQAIISATEESSENFYNNLREVNFEGCEVKELESGFNIVKKCFMQSKQKNKLWFQFDDILNEYKSDYNYDAFILGVYYGLRAYTKEHIILLDKIFALFKDKGTSKYTSFLEYAKNLDCIIDSDGKLEINEDRYQKLMNDKLFGTKLLDE